MLNQSQVNEQVVVLNISVLGSACWAEQSLLHIGDTKKESPGAVHCRKESKAPAGLRARDVSHVPCNCKSGNRCSLWKGSARPLWNSTIKTYLNPANGGSGRGGATYRPIADERKNHQESFLHLSARVNHVLPVWTRNLHRSPQCLQRTTACVLTEGGGWLLPPPPSLPTTRTVPAHGGCTRNSPRRKA